MGKFTVTGISKSGATIANLAIIRADTYSFTVTFTDSAGDAINVTGYTISLTCRVKGQDLTNTSTTTDSDAIFTTNATLTDPTNGVVTFAITTTHTDRQPAVYAYDIQLKTGSTITTAIYGELEIIGDVTRAR